jgi:hypothetical protein
MPEARWEADRNGVAQFIEEEPPSVPVPGLVEATATATFEHDGRPVFVRAREGRVLGSLAPADHPVVKARRDLWRPLKLPIDFTTPDRPRRALP